MAETALFRDLAVILLVAGTTSLLFYYLRQPVVLGYLLAGWFVGPFSPGPSFVGDGEVVSFLGEIGIIFLLFALGLEFNLRKLRRVGLTALVGGTIEIVLMLGLGYTMGRAFGWTPMEAVFLGAVMSISSTTIIVKVLAERHQKDEEWAQLAFGILIVEDILAVLILTGLSSAAATGNFQAEELGGLLYKLGIFLGAALLVGLLAAPRIVDRLAALEVEEVMVVLASGIGFGMALLASDMGFSPGLGAFVAGALMAESAGAKRIEPKIAPLRDVFTAVFFVTIGAMVDPAGIVQNWALILLVAAAVVVGKVVFVTVGTFLTGQPPSVALRVGLTLGQIGEFAFIIAALGATLAVSPPALFPITIAVCALTAFLTPFLIGASPRIVEGLSRRVPSGVHAYAASYRDWLKRLSESRREDPQRRALRRESLVAALSASVIVAGFALGALLADDVDGALRTRVATPLGVISGAWLGLSVLMAPFVLVWVRAIREIVNAMARLAVPARLRVTDECTTPERLLRRTFGLAATGITAAILVIAGGLFVDSILYVVALAASGVIISSVFLGRTLGRFHQEVEHTLERLMSDEEAAPASREEAMRLIETSGAWGASHREVQLPRVSGGGGRTIGQLRLRELTGASVVSVTRADAEDVLAPGPALRLAEGDKVLLVGDEGALTRAAEILLGRDLGVEGGATEITIEAGWAVVGRTLGQSALDTQTGVVVLLVRRDGEPLGADSHLELRAGDVLVVSGSEQEVAAVAQRARGAGGRLEPTY